MMPRESLRQAAEPDAAPNHKTPQFLTLIGILPQCLLLLAALIDDQASWTAPAAAFAYAASIFSFLGGYFWGVALTTQPAKRATFVVAVLPVLLSVALFLPWIWGWSWPGSQLIVLGIAIMASIFVDWRMIGTSIGSPTWFRARIIASLGLGISTIWIGVIAVGSHG